MRTSYSSGKRARENAREMIERKGEGGRGWGKESERENACVCACRYIGGTGSSPVAKGDNPLPEEFDRSSD